DTAMLAPQAGMLVPTEGHVRVDGTVRVDPYRTGFDLRHEAVHGFQIVRPDARAQAVRRVVGERRDLVEVVETLRYEHGAENFLLHDAHRALDVGHDGRLHVEAPMRRRVAAGDDGRALVAAGLDVADDAFLLLARHERAHLRARIEARSELDRLRRAADAFDDAIEDLPVHVQARARSTHLPGVEEDRARGAADDGLDVRIGQHNDRRLAAELERHTLQGVGRGFVDCLSDERGAGERDLVDTRMSHEGGADVLAVAGQNVDDAGRKARLDDQVAEPQRGERRLLGRFQDAGAAGRERGAELPRRHHERKIPRNDLCDDTDGLAARVRIDASALRAPDRNVDRRA